MNKGNVCADIPVQNVITDIPIEHMYSLQIALQERLGKAHNPNDSLVDIANKVIYWRHCIHTECDELVDWLDNDDATFVEAEMEVIDVLHFVFNIGIALGIPSSRIDYLFCGYSTELIKPNFDFIEARICKLSKTLTDLIDLLPWKTWKNYENSHVERDALLAAYVLVVRANLNLAALLGMSMERVVSVYCAKNAENHNRQNRGY